MTVEIGGEAKNVTVINVDMTDPHDPVYTIRSDKNEEWRYK
jgi:tRNA(Ser,Leu) C12 N-acetylase TAN1